MANLNVSETANAKFDFGSFIADFNSNGGGGGSIYYPDTWDYGDGSRMMKAYYDQDGLIYEKMELSQYVSNVLISQAVLTDVAVDIEAFKQLSQTGTAQSVAALVLQGADSLTGSSKVDILKGYTGDDTLIGAGGNDFLDGGKGSDVMGGGNGNDTYQVDSKHDEIMERNHQGTDLVKAWVTYTLANFVENLALAGEANLSGKGNALSNILTGNSGKNNLDGFAGADVIKGNGGADTIDGGKGNDTLTGNAASDVFVFHKGDGKDTVTDFSPRGGDVIDLSEVDLFRNLKDLKDHAEDTKAGDLLITFDKKDTLLIEHVHEKQLHASDFNF